MSVGVEAACLQDLFIRFQSCVFRNEEGVKFSTAPAPPVAAACVSATPTLRWELYEDVFRNNENDDCDRNEEP